MAGLIFRFLRGPISGPQRLGFVEMRRLKHAVLLALVLSGVGSAAFAAQTVGPRLPGEPAADPVALAMRYENGESVPRDYLHALALYCQAARGGDPRAFFNLGWMFLNGRGVARDEAAAVMWFRKAAERGVPQAVNLLGTAFPSTAIGGARLPGRRRGCRGRGPCHSGDPCASR